MKRPFASFPAGLRRRSPAGVHPSRLVHNVVVALALLASPQTLGAQCEGDLSWEYGENKEEGFSLGKLISNAVTPQIITDTKIIRKYIRDDRFPELTRRCGDLRAVDAIYQKALRVAEFNVGRGLLIAMMAVLEHQEIEIRVPVLRALSIPLSFEEDSLFKKRVLHLPARLYSDSPSGELGDKDKLQHFFASAYIAYASESSDITRGAGNAVEWGEAQFVVGGSDDPRDKRANFQGEAFGRDLLVVRNLLPSDYLQLPLSVDE